MKLAACLVYCNFLLRILVLKEKDEKRDWNQFFRLYDLDFKSNKIGFVILKYWLGFLTLGTLGIRSIREHLARGI